MSKQDKLWSLSSTSKKGEQTKDAIIVPKIVYIPSAIKRIRKSGSCRKWSQIRTRAFRYMPERIVLIDDPRNRYAPYPEQIPMRNFSSNWVRDKHLGAS
jgi:hypothetical protein